MWWKEEAEKAVCGKCSCDSATQVTEERNIRDEKHTVQKCLLGNNLLEVLGNLRD